MFRQLFFRVKNHIINERVKYLKCDTRNIAKNWINLSIALICIFHFENFQELHKV